AAQAMRRILVDHARTRNYQKRGGAARQVSLDEAMTVAEGRAAEMIALDEALAELGQIGGRESRGGEVRYFGRMSGEGAAGAAGDLDPDRGARLEHGESLAAAGDERKVESKMWEVKGEKSFRFLLSTFNFAYDA